MKKFLLKIIIVLANFFLVFFGFKLTKFPTAKIGALIEAYFQCLYLNKSKKMIFICTEEISNNYVFKHVRKKIKIYSSNFLTHLYFSKKGGKNYPDHKYYHSFPQKKYIDELVLNKQNHVIEFSENDKKKIISILDEIDFKKNFNGYEKFISLNLRSAIYHKDKNNTIRNNYDLESFNKIINFFKEKRILFITNLITEDINLNNSKDIDLLNKNLVLNINNLMIDADKKELLQLYFFNKSEFTMGCNAGSNFMPLLFNKKILLHNIAFPDYFYNHGNLSPILLPKKYLDIKNNKLINYKNILKPEIIKFKHNEELLNLGIKVIDNSDDELLLASKEMFSITNNEKKKIKSEQSDFWREFNSFYNVEMPDLVISKNFFENNKNLF